MVRYECGEKLIRLEEKATRAEGRNGIAVMNLQEFRCLFKEDPRGKILASSMENIQYSKAEVFGSCIVGTFTVPDKENLPGKKFSFGFYLRDSDLVFIDSTKGVEKILEQMSGLQFGAGVTVDVFLILMMNYLIQDDVLFLQEYEEGLAAVEEELLDHLPADFYQTVIRFRKELLILHTYYEQLVAVGEELEANGDPMFGETQREDLRIFASRASRLHDHVEMLREYVLQIREMYQSQIDIKQNQIMSWLTVVTTIFLPLSILVGWYGMNFTNMPELHWKYGYLAMIIVGFSTIAVEVLFFKKKKLL